ncbi:MAG: HD-GYP domain-containing protein [Actinomycetota bacterium]|nr:HD-GYP domain-containing protein [Actinomycetota bacterium]
MSLKPSLEDQQLLAETFRRAGARMTARERLSESVTGCGFVAAAAAIWWTQPPDSFAFLPAALCLLVMVLATRVRFDIPFGFTVPTQLAFVPLLFAMPLAIVPPAVVAALALARLPDVFAKEIRAIRLLQVVGNSWFAIGPVAAFALANTQPRDAGALLLIAALAAQFSVDFSISTLRFWIGRGATLSEQLRETWVYAIDAGLSGIALVIAAEIHSNPAAALAPVPVLALLAALGRERHERLENLLELNNAYRGTALVLGNIVEADDGYTGEHCKSVVELALALGEALGLKAEQQRNLEFAALLHDVGKIAIPKEIINKPGKLDPDEWAIIRTHTIEGQKILDQVGGFMHTVGLIVRAHHEHWDGAGYPDKLAGDEIPLEARIIAVCDTWNAMRTDRSYRRALPHNAALAELLSNAGAQFDPRVVTTFRTILQPNESHSHKPRTMPHTVQLPHRSARPIGQTPAS